MPDTYTITDLANDFGITPRTLRFYEDKGLIHPRRKGSQRIYGRRDRGRLQLILRGKRLGFSLADIKEMLDLYEVGDGQVIQMRAMLDRSRERVAELKAQRRDIDAAIRELTDACRQIESFLTEKEGASASGRDKREAVIEARSNRAI